MNSIAFEIPELVRLKALSEGQAGETWLGALPSIVTGLAAQWRLSVGRTLTGGTEAFVAEVTMPDGREAVLKIGRPACDTACEINILLAAAGRGYVEVYDYDHHRKAILLERLGPQLGELGLPVAAQIEAVCATLNEAWTADPKGVSLMDGAEKAKSLGEFIQALWLELGRPCPERVIGRALHYAKIRGNRFDPGSAVLGHGDAHAWNALADPRAGSGKFKFVDPEGLFIEKAYDLGIQMREWTSDLLAGDPVTLGRSRCGQLARLTGVDPEPIWQWGFIERVSSGLLCMKIGIEGARDMLAVADAWALGVPE